LAAVVSAALLLPSRHAFGQLPVPATSSVTSQPTSASQPATRPIKTIEAVVPGGVLRLGPVATDKGQKLVWRFQLGAKTTETTLAQNGVRFAEPMSMLLSPGGKYLALNSQEDGCYGLQVLDFPSLFPGGKIVELWTVGTFPGSVQAVRWEKDRLIVKSTMLLTVPEPDAWLAFDKEQEFAIDMPSKKVTGLSDDAKNPVGYFIGKLSDKKSEVVYDAVMALSDLRAAEALPALRDAQARIEDKITREMITRAIRKIESASANSQPTSMPTTAP